MPDLAFSRQKFGQETDWDGPTATVPAHPHIMTFLAHSTRVPACAAACLARTFARAARVVFRVDWLLLAGGSANHRQAPLYAGAMSGDHLPSRNQVVRGDPVALLMFHFPNDVVTAVPKWSDRAGLPPPGYLTVCEISLLVGLRFPPPIELIKISGLIEKWGKMRDLPAPLHVREEDIMRILKIPNFEYLLYGVRYLNKYIEEEFMFRVGLSFHAGRSDALILKPSSKIPEPPAPTTKVAPKRQAGGEDPQVLLKKKLEGVATSTSKVPPDSSPIKFHIPGDVLSHQYIIRHKADDLLSRSTELKVELIEALNKWNAKSMKVKYLQGEYKRKYDLKTKEINLKEAQVTTTQLRKYQKASVEKVTVLEAENKRSQTLITEKEATLIGFESSRVIKDFKNFIAFKTIIQEHWKTGVEIEGLTPSKAFDDSPPDSDGGEIESELQKAFALEVDDEIGFSHRGEKRQMPGIPDSGTDFEIDVNWSGRFPRCDYCAYWPLQWYFRIVGLAISHKRCQIITG
ncbi:hypothetical protein IEQ34_008596 [Dendrobium chrysotoxum]|uniref:Uncharacterized protein n=1 Tax=Dendrobium chrysotoxum TaxID=161865 RepID=A0AAV7GWF1_DENCH|nr:hypothetical protein IEQ34_008596 [Dendrobium chrysotoxum]